MDLCNNCHKNHGVASIGLGNQILQLCDDCIRTGSFLSWVGRCVGSYYAHLESSEGVMPIDVMLDTHVASFRENVWEGVAQAHAQALYDLNLKYLDEKDRNTPKPGTVERNKLTNGLRYDIMQRDGLRCQLCGVTGEDAKLVVDHIHPVSKGGKTEPINLRTLCFECNSGKAAKVENSDATQANA